jgi:hypothetical protein
MKLRPEIKFLHSPQLPDLEESLPSDPADFEILVQALIGLPGEEAADTFDFIVCTPNRLAAQVASEGPQSGRGYIFMAKYDYAELRAIILGICEKAAGDSWPEIAAILSRYSQWEYEEDAA